MTPTTQPLSLPEVTAEPTRQSLRVLVVDDNVDAAQTLGLLLEASVHDVRTAYDGLSAVKTAVDFRPNVVLLDIGLPGLDGFEVAKRLRKDSSLDGVVLVAMTGYGQATDKLRSQDAGFNHHLVKPADFGKVQEILETFSAKAAPAALSPSLEQSNPTGASFRVLVVDDMRDATHMLRTLLNRAGHDVRTAADGPTALAAALEYRPDIVISDISLPGMSGLELAKQIRQQSTLKDIVLVALTGHGEEADRQRSFDAGFNHHLVKPADIRLVQEILKTVSARATK
nr:response regulator [Lignipirellula cremea]